MKISNDMRLSITSNIWRMLMILASLLGAVSESEAADRFYPEAVNLEPGETRRIGFILENSQELFGFQADITLPEGVEFVTVNGKPGLTLSARADGSYTTVSNLTAPGAVRFGAFSATHTSIGGSDGALLYAEVRASDTFKGGMLSVSDIRFIDSDDRDVVFPDFTTEIGDRHADSFYIPPFTIAAGETRTIAVILDNETAFTAFQTDLYLPEGLAAVEGSFRLTDRAGEGHTVAVRSFDGGRTRIACLSVASEPFGGNSGALLEFDLTADRDLTGIYTIELKNQIFVTKAAGEYMLLPTTTEVTSTPLGIETIFTDTDGTMDVYTPAGTAVRTGCTSTELRTLPPGIYIIRSGTTAKAVCIGR